MARCTIHFWSSGGVGKVQREQRRRQCCDEHSDAASAESHVPHQANAPISARLALITGSGKAEGIHPVPSVPIAIPSPKNKRSAGRRSQAAKRETRNPAAKSPPAMRMILPSPLLKETTGLRRDPRRLDRGCSGKSLSVERRPLDEAERHFSCRDGGI